MSRREIAARLRSDRDGRVQGVFFRARRLGRRPARLGLDGFARNLAEGTVEIVAEGDRTVSSVLAGWAHRGSAHGES